LESQYIENITLAYDGTSTLALVCKLLTELLAEDKKQLVISSRPEGYIYDSTKAIGINNPLKVLITSAEQTKKGTRAEVSMSGVIEGQNDEKHSFSLYFTMQGEVPIPIKGTHKENLVGKVLHLNIMGATGYLYDSLYSLTLQHNSTSKGNTLVGDGRGYLVFSEEAQEDEVK
jgi:hypothetical protein